MKRMAGQKGSGKIFFPRMRPTVERLQYLEKAGTHLLNFMAFMILPVDAVPTYILLVVIAGIVSTCLTALLIEARRQKVLISENMVYQLGEWAGWTYRGVRRLVILAVGSTVILIGFIMVALPGPATLVIPLGLAILATEFAWARRILRRAAVIVRMARKKLRT